MNLKQIVEDTDTKGGRLFDHFSQFFIVVSIVGFSIETLPKISHTFQTILWVLEVVIVILFTAEYLLRVWVADRKLKYIFSFFGLIDFLAILPFYLGGVVDLRAIRIVRLIRVFRLVKIMRYGKAIERFKKAISDIKEELVVYLTAVFFLLFIASVGIYYFEREAQPEHFSSIFHSMWWSLITLTTVGYGDVYPVTLGGRIFTGFVIMTGLSIIPIPSGLLAAALIKPKKDSD